jgi:hypothetical protein
MKIRYKYKFKTFMQMFILFHIIVLQYLARACGTPVENRCGKITEGVSFEILN